MLALGLVLVLWCCQSMSVTTVNLTILNSNEQKIQTSHAVSTTKVTTQAPHTPSYAPYVLIACVFAYGVYSYMYRKSNQDKQQVVWYV
jgi:hypothetical protein